MTENKVLSRHFKFVKMIFIVAGYSMYAMKETSHLPQRRKRSKKSKKTRPKGNNKISLFGKNSITYVCMIIFVIS